MGHEEKETFVNLRKGERHDELIETGEDGKERFYYPKRYTVRLECEKLQVCSVVSFEEGDENIRPAAKPRIRGIARIESSANVSLIGEPENRAVRFELSILADESPGLLNPSENEVNDKEMFFLSKPFGRACMGFNRADWEIDSDDQWWLEVRLNGQLLQPVIEAINSGHLERLSLGVQLKNLFTDEHPYAPSFRYEQLFLRPRAKDNSLKMPELAYGWLTELGLGLRSVDLTPKTESEPEEELHPVEEAMQETLAEPEVLAEVQASLILAAHLEALRGTIRWVGGAIVVALVFLVIK